MSTNKTQHYQLNQWEDVYKRQMYGGQSTHIPMKVNMSGVMPIIFAQSIASLPATIGAFTGATAVSYTHLDVYKRQR